MAADYCPAILCQGHHFARLILLFLLLRALLPDSAGACPVTFDDQPGQTASQTNAPAATSPADSRQASQPSAMALPDEPKPQPEAAPAEPNPCTIKNLGASMGSTAMVRAATALNALDLNVLPKPAIVDLLVCLPHAPAVVDWYARFVTGPEVKPLTPRQKARLAVKNVIDPFNLITIAGESGISTAANSHSVYGPGFFGWSKDGGVSLTQDITGEFFGTFLIPSIAHQDPHYHRMPKASIARRILHCIDQVAWTQGDNGRGMVNYADLVGFAFDDAVDDLYVPGQQTNFRASAVRYATGLGTAPTDNFITEFLPDIASKIHVRVVLVQRIINQVASKDGVTQ
ncbi:MAG: hypothetical protein ABR928_09400 [Terracidiphilus sp.]|jgi:hypothetical protein